MTILKILGWIFVPFIMIFIQWKRLNVAVKVIGIVWAGGMLIGYTGFHGNSTPTTAPADATTNGLKGTLTQTVPAATATPAALVAATPTPESPALKATQAEIDATNAATAQFKLDMLTTDIASDIRAEDKHLALLDSILQQGKTQQAYSSAQSMSDGIDRGQKMYQTIYKELEPSPIQGKLKEIASNAEINIQGYQNGYKDYMKFLDSGKQSDLYNATQNFTFAKSSMQDLENQLVKMGGHDQP
jgi:hypothetical protein